MPPQLIRIQVDLSEMRCAVDSLSFDPATLATLDDVLAVADQQQDTDAAAVTARLRDVEQKGALR